MKNPKTRKRKTYKKRKEAYVNRYFKQFIKVSFELVLVFLVFVCGVDDGKTDGQQYTIIRLVNGRKKTNVHLTSTRLCQPNTVHY